MFLPNVLLAKGQRGWPLMHRLLVDLFQRCGSAELSFLVNSGLSFGCVLGIFQMLLWLVYEVGECWVSLFGSRKRWID